jgi:hypothetical protein
MGPQLWRAGWVRGVTAFENASFSCFAHCSNNRIGLLFRQTHAAEGIIDESESKLPLAHDGNADILSLQQP